MKLDAVTRVSSKLVSASKKWWKDKFDLFGSNLDIHRATTCTINNSVNVIKMG